MTRKTEDRRQKSEVRSQKSEDRRQKALLRCATQGRQTTDDGRRRTSDERRLSGSAIILVVVLTSLLAIIGVVFLLTSRVDSIATSAISENKELNLAVDTVIAQISENLALDVPGVAGQEYYDYPDVNNAWLASLEPNVDKLWPHITDLNYQLGLLAHNMPIDIVPDYQPRIAQLDPADADGDGVADSRWVLVWDVNSNKGKPVFAAVRVIDNGGMLNVNTGFKFDPCDLDITKIDGSSQMQINLWALSRRGATPNADNVLQTYRCGTEPNALYEPNVVWRYGNPAGAYTPFDISDELKLRNRYILLNYNNPIKTRIGNVWDNVFNIGLEVPVQSISDPNDWFWRTNNLSTDPEVYDYRHIATIYNCDRIINPTGEKMFNVNFAANPAANKSDVYRAVRGALDLNIPDNDVRQITANLIDYLDSDSQVTVFVDPNDPNNKPYYGFETPCIYISEIAQRFVKPADPNAPVTRSYAIELYKPYAGDLTPSDPNEWQLVINPGSSIPLAWVGNSSFYVLWNTDDVNAPIDINVVDANVVPIKDMNFVGGSHIWLQRKVDPNLPFLTVDGVDVPEANASSGWLMVFDENDVNNNRTRSFQRDIWPHKPIRRLWGISDSPSIGYHAATDFDAFVATGDPFYALPIQAHPANAPFTNIGEIGMLFRVDGYLIGSAETEADVRLNLRDQAVQQIFKYLTVMDPADPKHGTHPADETRIKGRININTAPWFVLAQLPWVSQRIGDPNADYRLARAIVANRDTFGPFQNIGQLNRVVDVGVPAASIDYYWRGNGDLLTFPDLTPGDGAPNDFEERDVIFARISNLVTVRSDVFTAYILVRIGQDGPQKRVIAILDRSGVTPTAGGYTGKVKVLAVYPVPDPR